MRGTLFKDGIEYNVEINGESWIQGQTIKGVLRLKGQGDVSPVRVILGYGKFKNIKSLAEDKKWEIIEEIVLSDSTSANPAEYQEFEWSFNLAEDAPITDKQGSLFLLYGPDGCLQLNIEMKEIFKQYLEIFENFFRFKAAQIKYKKGGVDIKFNPPKSNELASVDGLNSFLQLKEDNFVIKYNFKLTSLDSIGGSVMAKKKEKEIITELTPKEYLIYGSSPNQEKIIDSIKEVIQQVKPKFMG